METQALTDTLFSHLSRREPLGSPGLASPTSLDGLSANEHEEPHSSNENVQGPPEADGTAPIVVDNQAVQPNIAPAAASPQLVNEQPAAEPASAERTTIGPAATKPKGRKYKPGNVHTAK